uniref:Peptidase C15, pyroglutamyl peptidase I-like protein n=1 Tax=Parastrongyloides trichosuri TaxID=131310 RepID=A0A0N4ZT71_PARTI
MSRRKTNVLLTGYGPFNSILDNPSKALVSEIGKDFEDDPGSFDYNLETITFPVSYRSVSEEMKCYYETGNIDYFIHLGVNANSKYIILETEAEGYGYCLLDTEGNIPENKCCISYDPNAPQSLKSSLPLQKICSEMNAKNDFYPIMLSTDPGKFLCSFLYYQTLYHSSKSVFIHVPNVGQNDDSKFDDILITIRRIIDKIVCEGNELLNI